MIPSAEVEAPEASEQFAAAAAQAKGVIPASADDALAALDAAYEAAGEGTALALDADMVNVLNGVCAAMVNGMEYQTGRRFRDWADLGPVPNTNPQEKAYVHLAPIQGVHLNTPASYSRWRAGAVFKISHDLDDDPPHAYNTAGPGCIILKMVGNELRMVGLSRADDVLPFKPTDIARRPAGFQEREDAKLHRHNDPGVPDLGDPNPQPGVGNPDHSGPHTCFSCMATGWCEAHGPTL